MGQVAVVVDDPLVVTLICSVDGEVRVIRVRRAVCEVDVLLRVDRWSAAVAASEEVEVYRP
jgi:hypothetical protein